MEHRSPPSNILSPFEVTGRDRHFNRSMCNKPWVKNQNNLHGFEICYKPDEIPSGKKEEEADQLVSRAVQRRKKKHAHYKRNRQMRQNRELDGIPENGIAEMPEDELGDIPWDRIAELQEDELAAITENRIAEVPEKRFTATPENRLVEDPREQNAEVVQAIFQSRAPPRKVYLLEFKRSPEVFCRVLLEAPDFGDWRQELTDAGYDVLLSQSNAKMFVHKEEYAPVLKKVSEDALALHARHVFVSEEREPILLSVLADAIPSRCGVKPKNRKVIDVILEEDEDSSMVNSDFDDLSSRSDAQEPSAASCSSPFGPQAPSTGDFTSMYVVKRTFLHFPIPSSLWSGPSEGQHTLSTTDADSRAGPNPRFQRSSRRIAPTNATDEGAVEYQN